MRYRLGTLLFTVTVTAVALASGRQLSQYRDRTEFTAILLLWTITGFTLGASATQNSLTPRWRWPLAICGSVAIWLLYFFADFALGNLREPQVEATFPAVLVFLLSAHDAWVLLGCTAALTAAILFTAQTERIRLLGTLIVLSLLMWLLVFWIGFLGTSVALLNDWSD